MDIVSIPLQKAAIALKNGTVPGMGIEYLCTGRETQLDELRNSLDFAAAGGGIIKVICGEYGSGKTFFLQRAKLEAFRKNFVVASIKVNQGLRLNLLNHLYYNIMHNLFVLDRGESKTSFEDLFEKWLESVRAMEDSQAAARINQVLSDIGKFNESFARAFAGYIKARIAGDRLKSRAIVSWITGEENIPYEIKSSFDVTGNVDRMNAMDFLKAFLKLLREIGYAGLVVMIDELELVMDERVDLRKKAYENIRYIVDECALNELNGITFLFAATEDILTDETKGIPSYEALSQRFGNQADKKGSSLSDVKQPVLYLPAFPIDQLRVLSEKIITMHKEVYDLKPQISSESIVNWALLLYKEKGGNLESINARKYIMKLIEVLDIIEQHPENPMFRTELSMIEKGGMITFRNMRVKSNAL